VFSSVENLAFHKESWVSNRRQLKRHVRNQWKHGHAARAVDGQSNNHSLESCTVLDNFDVDKPVWMVNVGRKAKISGVIIQTWLGGADNGMSCRLLFYFITQKFRLKSLL
jgi:hypothetical protein